jgi:hypothetical protein
MAVVQAHQQIDQRGTGTGHLDGLGRLTVLMRPVTSIVGGRSVDWHHAGRWEPAGCVLAIPLHLDRAEADHAKSDQVRMAQDVAGMFDELKTLSDKHAELHADRARLRAELEQARWRRLIGR